MNKQLNLFSEEEIAPQKRTTHLGGSSSGVVFRNYEDFLKKFTEAPKTTDDCYTPRDVYEAVVKYVSTVADIQGKVICRPFYPGGDYENEVYPENGVVIDNPPFSLFTKICAFYTLHKIPFFLFGPGLTIASVCPFCTAVIISNQITFENGAVVKCNFASNLFGDTIIMTAPLLDNLIERCPSQNQKVNLPSYGYPEEVLAVSDMQTICSGDILFSVSRDEAKIIKGLDNHPKGGKSNLFGNHFLLAKAKAKAKAIIPIHLSPREKQIVSELHSDDSPNNY